MQIAYLNKREPEPKENPTEYWYMRDIKKCWKNRKAEIIAAGYTQESFVKEMKELLIEK